MENSDKTECGAEVFEDNTKTVVFLRSPSTESSSGSYRRTMSSSDKLNSTLIYCRICHEDESLEELIDPCKCAGSLGLVHTGCLEKWLSTSNTDRCEICKYVFTVERKNKPITQWWRSSSVNGPRGLAGDAICLLILTPLCLAATYLCALGASAYSRHGYWEGTGLAVLCSLLIATYCLWLAITLRFHYKIWLRWRRQNQDVVLLVKKKSDSTGTASNGNGETLNAEKSPAARAGIQDRNNNRSTNNQYARSTGFFFWCTIHSSGGSCLHHATSDQLCLRNPKISIYLIKFYVYLDRFL